MQFLCSLSMGFQGKVELSVVFHLQGAVLLDPHAQAVVSRQEYGQLGPVSSLPFM